MACAVSAIQAIVADMWDRLYPRTRYIAPDFAQQPYTSPSAAIAITYEDCAWIFAATAIIYGTKGELGCPL